MATFSRLYILISWMIPVTWFVAYKLINNFWLWLLFVPLSLVLIRTIRSWYFKEDIFDHTGLGYIIAHDLKHEETLEHECQPIHSAQEGFNSFLPPLITQPHICQPEVLYTENGKWKATITHTKWHLIPGLKSESEFTVRYERV